MTDRPAVAARPVVVALTLALVGAGGLAVRPVAAQRSSYDVVIRNGRVLDPETGLDAVRSVGIRNGVIAAISRTPLTGRRTIDATGLVVAPGFVDLHAHGQDDENYRLYAQDGVTTALELEVGTEDVPAWYAARADGTLINVGVAASHLRARMLVLRDGGMAQGTLLPLDSAGRRAATDDEIAEIRRVIDRGLDAGGLGVGMGLAYTPAATKHEVVEAFRSAARRRAPVFVHTRSTGETDPGSSVEAYLEVIAASAVTGAPLHIVHLNSTSASSTPRTLALVTEARQRGLDVTAEAYPYIAGMTELASPLFDRFLTGPDSMFGTLMLPRTGERLTRATFLANRVPKERVIIFLNTPAMEALAITSPVTAIASDGGVRNGIGHPRTAGTFARVLGHYVRDTRQLTLMQAITKMTLMPARRLETLAPAFRRKGRLQVGADADVTIFDPATVQDRATYTAPALPSEGFRHVLVAGVSVVTDGRVVEGTRPGRPLRGTVRP